MRPFIPIWNELSVESNVVLQADEIVIHVALQKKLVKAAYKTK